MEILKEIERELRNDPDLMSDIREMAIRHSKGRNRKDRASDGFLHNYLNHDKDGARLYGFFEEFRNRRGWNQKQCPKWYFLTVLRTIMKEVASHA